MQSTSLLSALAASCWLIAAPASAQSPPPPSTATASIGSLRYELVDLTPGDGHAPWLELEARQGSMLYGINPPTGYGRSGWLDEYGEIDLVERRNRFTVAVGTERVSVGVSVLDPSVNVLGISQFGFRLSPHTQVVFMADASVDTFSADEDVETYAAAHLYGWLEGETQTTASLIRLNGNGPDLETLQVTFGSADFSRSGNLNIDSAAWANLTAVPEPGQAAMLLLGLSALLTATRLRYRMTGAAPRPHARAHPSRWTAWRHVAERSSARSTLAASSISWKGLRKTMSSPITSSIARMSA